ncbi:MAG: transketolase C-terminal domain-containing protein [Nitrososphaerota archaeon]|nr:transketolase C-terminal domain-containing protein [Nitrososphaerota archaeon]
MITKSLSRQHRIALTGNDAVAYAVKQAKVDVISAYPITPQTFVVETLSRYVYDGELDAKFIAVESEHSAMSAVIGASLAGARTFTATSSQGLAYMWEALYAASGLRLPIVMALAARALSAPLNIHNDHSDFFGMRDAGWIMFNGEEAQETYDLTIMAYKIAEDPRVLLPVVVSYDGFIVSHAISDFYALNDDVVAEFLGKRTTGPKIDPDNPRSFGVLALQDSYFEFKRQQYEAMEKSRQVIQEVFKKYAEISGREYRPLKEYMTEDAETCIVAMGSTVGTARQAIRILRERGEKVGVVGILQYRPWPTKEVEQIFSKFKKIIVMEKTVSHGARAGPMYEDIASTLYPKYSNVKMIDYTYGLGGRDISPQGIIDIYRFGKELIEKDRNDKVQFYGVRE